MRFRPAAGAYNIRHPAAFRDGCPRSYREVHSEVRTMKRAFGMSVICALAVALAAPVAFAQDDPTRETYREGPTILQDLEGPPPSDSSDGGPSAEPAESAPEDTQGAPGDTQEAAGDTLPFTGLDVALVALMGVALVGTGVAMRRTVRGPQA